MELKKKNRGDALIMVIVVIAFVSILISSLYMLSITNLQMKSVDLQAKENFYSAEEALEQIQLGLQEEMADAAKSAYIDVVQNYVTTNTELARRNQFTTAFLTDLTGRIQDTGPSNYSLDKLNDYLSAEVEANTALSSSDTNCRMVMDTDSIVLKDLVIEYTNANGYQSIIETDIRLTVPNPNFVQPADMPDVFEYSIIANKLLQGQNTGTVTIGANVYAGENGLILPEGADWSINQASRLVVAGPLEIAREASLNGSSDLDVWVKGIQVNGGTMSLAGKTYVAEDLLLNNSGSKVTLEGEYYGYGNGNAISGDGTIQDGGGEYSAILVNGTNTTLDMTEVRKLLLSGSAKLTTSKVYHEDVEVEIPSNPSQPETPSEPEPEPDSAIVLEEANLAEGIYTWYFGGADLYAGCYRDWYGTDIPLKSDFNTAGDNRNFELTYNSDGTISLKNVYLDSYVSLTTDATLLLRANSSTIGNDQKFKLYVISEGPSSVKGQYVMQCVANGKYVGTVTEYGYEYLVAANQSSVEGTNAIFELNYVGGFPVDPVVTVTYDSSSQATFKISCPDISSATYIYTTRRQIFGSYYRETDNSVTMSRLSTDAGSKDTFYITTSNFDWEDEYEITYRTSTGDSGSITFTYDLLTQQGNAVEPQGTAQFEDGVYALKSDSGYSSVGYASNKTSYPLYFSGSSMGTSQELILLNHSDGTVSFLTPQVGSYNVRYLSVRDDGTVTASATTISDREKFYIGYDKSTEYYYLQSKYNSQYVYVNTGAANYPATMTGSSSQRSGFQFVYLEYTAATPTALPTPDEDESTDSGETPGTGGNGGSGETVEVSGVNKDITLGEALQVKSNQIAYLVPKECIGVNEGDTIVGRNPMSVEDYAVMMSYADDAENYPDFEVVSFTKEVEGLGKTLGDYHTEGTTGYQVIFQTIPGDTTLVYFYLAFDQDNLSRYFRDYYAAYKDTLDGYMNYYVDDIALNNLYSRLTLRGNMVYSEPNVSGGFSIKSNEGVGANLTEEERNSLVAEESGYQRSFYALSKKLVLDYSDLSSTEKSRDVFDNLIRENAFAGLGSGVNTYTSDSGTASAVVVDNAGSSPYVYDSSQSSNICLILASGDVEIQKNFSGIVIAGGTVTVNSPCSIMPNRDSLNTILQTMTSDDVTAKTIIETFFIDGENYVLDNAGTNAAVTGKDVISYSDLITYEGWTKR